MERVTQLRAIRFSAAIFRIVLSFRTVPIIVLITIILSDKQQPGTTQE